MFEPASHPRSPLFARALSAASVIKFSRDRVARAELLTGHAAALADKLVLETLDGDGVRFRMPKRSVWHRREPFTAARILDTTGAGDWFSAGLLYQVARRAGSRLAFANVKPAVDFAQMLAAASIGFRGARGYQDYCSGPKILSLVEGIGMVGKPTPLGEEGESSIEPAEGTDCPVCLRTLVQSDPGASTN